MKPLPFSNEAILSKYLQLVKLLADAQKRALATKAYLNIKLVTGRRALIRKLIKLLKSKFLLSIQSYILSFNCFLRETISSYLTSFVNVFNERGLAYFVYHFIALFQAIFLLKMILEWFPVKNWDRAQPLIRFLRRVTDWWTRKFDEYVPSAVAWIIVINIIPLLLLFLGEYYKWYDLSDFPVSYTADDYFKFMLLTQAF